MSYYINLSNAVNELAWCIRGATFSFTPQSTVGFADVGIAVLPEKRSFEVPNTGAKGLVSLTDK